MAFAIKLSYHKRLFIMLLAFSWAILLCFVTFQYFREKQYKSEYLNAQLQLYNKHFLRAVTDGCSYDRYMSTHDQPFDDLRLSVIGLV